MKKKKLNPRRIPLSKSQINTDDILDEATKDDIYHAWLLIVHSLLELELIPLNEIAALADSVNRGFSSPQYKHSALPMHRKQSSLLPGYKAGDAEMARAEQLMGIPIPYDRLNPDHIHSPVQLEAFKKKVKAVAIHTSLCVLCLSLEASGRFTASELRRLFFDVDMTMAEIERGVNSYDGIAEALETQMVDVSVAAGECCKVEAALKSE